MHDVLVIVFTFHLFFLICTTTRKTDLQSLLLILTGQVDIPEVRMTQDLP